MNKSITAIIVFLGAGLFAQTEVQAQDRWRESSVRIQVGEFRPDGDSQYWNDQELDFTAQPNDYEDAAVGISWLRPLGPRVTVHSW